MDSSNIIISVVLLPVALNADIRVIHIPLKNIPLSRCFLLNRYFLCSHNEYKTEIKKRGQRSRYIAKRQQRDDFGLK